MSKVVCTRKITARDVGKLIEPPTPVWPTPRNLYGRLEAPPTAGGNPTPATLPPHWVSALSDAVRPSHAMFTPLTPEQIEDLVYRSKGPHVQMIGRAERCREIRIDDKLAALDAAIDRIHITTDEPFVMPSVFTRPDPPPAPVETLLTWALARLRNALDQATPITQTERHYLNAFAGLEDIIE